MSTKFKALTFDFWNTLALPNPEYAANRINVLMRYSSLSQEETIKAYKNVKQSLDNYAAGGDALSIMSAHNILYGAMNPSELGYYEPSEVTKLSRDIQDLALMYPPIINSALMIQLDEYSMRNNIPIGIISNTNFIGGATLIHVLSKQCNTFDAYLFSDMYMISKPNKQFFYTAAKLLLCDAPDILHVGDSEQYDGAGARASNFQFKKVQSPDDTLKFVTELNK